MHLKTFRFNEVRPCEISIYGKYYPGLFHKFITVTDKLCHPYQPGETVALVETRGGGMTYVSPKGIKFLDTEKQMKKLGFKFAEQKGKQNLKTS